jgi:hypothetical protein
MPTSFLVKGFDGANMFCANAPCCCLIKSKISVFNIGAWSVLGEIRPSERQQIEL